MRLLRSTGSAALALAGLLTAQPPPGMVFVPGGEFQRGRSHPLPDDGLKWFPELLKDDRPVRTILVDPFYLDVHEVTNEQYAEFLRATGRQPPFYWVNGAVPEGKARHPVVNVTWHDAEAYARWAGKRLPAEAEWERACRALAEGRKYPWGDEDPGSSSAHYNAVTGPVEVGRFPPNRLGLQDMAGNVWEWCSDWYDPQYYERAPARNPRGPQQGLYRVIRGGSWADVAKYLTCSYRSWARPAERSPNIGFRCARSVRR